MSNGDIRTSLAEIEQLQSEIRKKEEEICAIRASLLKLRHTVDMETRKGIASSDARSAMSNQQDDLASKMTQLDAKIDALKNRKLALFTENTVQQTAQLCSDKVPFLMLPVRLETKYMNLDTDHPELWVRIFPDDIAIDTHETSFTEEEVRQARSYFEVARQAGPKEEQIKADLTDRVGEEKRDLVLQLGERRFLDDPDVEEIESEGLSPEEIEAATEYWQHYKDIRMRIVIPAWKEMVDCFGPFRSAYILSKGEEFFTGDSIPMRPESWSRAPRSYVMPDQFIIRLYRKRIVDGQTLHEVWKDEAGNPREQIGKPINRPLCVGPDPLSEGEDPNQLFFDAESDWMINFDRAVNAGMGVKIDLRSLSAAEIKEGFSRIIALGITTPREATGHIDLVKQLFENHHYSGGFSILKQGTPTNNTAETVSEYDSSEGDYQESFDIEFLHDNFPSGESAGEKERKDGFRLANALGLKNCLGVFRHIKGAAETDNCDAQHMARALWPVTWGYYLGVELFDKLSFRIDIAELMNHFLEYVRARGPFPSVRIGDMPYGILPTSAFSSWQVRDDEQKKAFYEGLCTLLQRLSRFWHKLSSDVETVPRVGASNDPDEEIVRIMGMQASSFNFHIRSIVEESYLKDLLGFIWPSAFRLDNLWNRIGAFLGFSSTYGADPDSQMGGPGSFQKLWDKYSQKKEESTLLFKELTDQPSSVPILATTTWSDGYPLDLPMVQEGPLSESLRLKEDYIKTLLDCELTQIAGSDFGQSPAPPTLLFMLLRLAILSENPDWSAEDIPLRISLDYLRKLPSAKLERLLSEVLDLSAHRLDAWITSLITKRILRLRNSENAEGIYLGSFGWLEDLVPAPGGSTGGYIHAPSVSHGITAAVLRNAYLSHADSDNAERMTVNLTSARVKKALWFLEGMRQGQSVNVLLGCSFERSLHEIHKRGNRVVELDQYIAPFRRLYPLDAGKVTEVEESESVEAMAPRNVVDGLALLKAYRSEEGSAPIPFNSDNELPDSGSDPYKAIIMDLDDLDETFDAVNDLLLSESVHRAVLGDYLGSGAALDAIAADGSPPDEFLVGKTPRGGVNIKHNCLVLLPGSGNFSDCADCFLHRWPADQRSALSPALNAWAAKILGDPGKIVGHAEYVSSGSVSRVKLSVLGVIDPGSGEIGQAFGFSPLEFVYLSSSSLSGEVSELEETMEYYIKKNKNLSRDCEIIFDFARDENYSGDEKTFTEVLPLARAFLTVITGAAYLKPEDLYLPEETEVGDEEPETEFAGFSAQDYQWIKDQIRKDDGSGVYERLASLYDTLNSAVGNEELDRIREAMEHLRSYGVPGAIPQSVIEANEVAKQELIAQAGGVLKEVEERLGACGSSLTQAESLKPAEADSLSTDIKNEMWANAIEQLVQCFKALLGKSFIFLPRFTASNHQELALTFGNTSGLLDGEDERWPLTWFQQAAQTHPNLHRMESLMMLAEIKSHQSMELSIGQLPNRDENRWVALPWRDGMNREKEEHVQGSLSLVTYTPFPVDYSGPVAGFVLDKWDEIIPADEENTSLVYQYNRPSCESPNSCLLCVSPVVGEEDGHWQWEHLVGCIEETLDMVKIRAVDLDAFKKLGRFLPAIYLPGKTQSANQTIQFPFPITGGEA